MGVWSYYLFMGLLITTLVLWAIVALRDDGNEQGNAQPHDAEDEVTKKS